MGTLQLSALDAAIVAVYLVGITAIGLWASRTVKTSGDFFLAGRSLPWWVAGMSLVVSDIGAKDMIGLAGDAYRYGIVMMNFDFIACTMPLLVAAFPFMPLFWGAGVTTIPEYLGRRYNAGVRTFFAVIWALFMVGTVATIFVSAAAMFEGLLGWSFWFSVGLTSVVVAIFTTSGGLRAVAITDVFSCIVLIGGAALLCVIGLREVGGLTSMMVKVSALPWTAEHFELLPSASHDAFPWPLRVGRWLVIVLIVLGAILSYQVKVRFGSVFEAFQTFLSFFQGALFALLLFGMVTRRATAAGGVAGMLAGVGTAAAMSATGQLYLWTAWWSFVAASLTLVGVSLLTTPKSDDDLRGLVCWVRR